MKKIIFLFFSLVFLMSLNSCDSKYNRSPNSYSGQEFIDSVLNKSYVKVDGHDYILYEKGIRSSYSYSFQLIHRFDSCQKCLEIYD